MIVPSKCEIEFLPIGEGYVSATPLPFFDRVEDYT